MYRTVLVPVNSSVPSAQAARHALDLSRLLGCRVTMVHVLDDDASDDARLRARETLERLSAGARFPPRLRVAESRGRSIPDAIIEIAREESADLILIGTHGRDGLERLVLGSVAQAVAARAALPVLVIPERPEAPARIGARFLRAAGTGG